MGLSKFQWRLLLWLLLLLGEITLLAFLLIRDNLHITKFLLLVIIALTCMQFWNFVQSFNRSLVTFIRDFHGGYGERLVTANQNDQQKELCSAINSYFEHHNRRFKQQEIELDLLRAQMELLPTPVVRISAQDEVTLNNRAARKLFAGVVLKRSEDFGTFGDDFVASIRKITVGQRNLVWFQHDDIYSQMLLTCSEVQVSPKAEKDRLIAIHNIQKELEKSEIDSWQNLVNVLTHEIMNSLTPISSLSASVMDLMEEFTATQASYNPHLMEINSALQLISKRAEHLMEFVQDYRKITVLPRPILKNQDAVQILSELVPLVTNDWQALKIKVTLEIQHKSLHILADRKLIENTVINLLKNAKEALVGTLDPQVIIAARTNRLGRVIISVSDNGPLIDEEHIKNIFLPFFTTKPDGSGVGLSVAKKVMIAHSGSINYDVDGNYKSFNLVF